MFTTSMRQHSKPGYNTPDTRARGPSYIRTATDTRAWGPSYIMMATDTRAHADGDEVCDILCDDKLHLSTHVIKKLCSNIKYGLYRCFNIKPHSQQKPPQG